jgi:hypothetical protein
MLEEDVGRTPCPIKKHEPRPVAGAFFDLNAPSGVGLVVVVMLSALVNAATVGQVSAAGRLESVIVAERLTM